MRKEYQKYAFYLLVASGLCLWIINWWAGRPLFIDEANVARNLYDRSFGGLFLPLDHQQYAPPFYLLLAKASGELWGYGELALRLPAMIGGLLAIAGLWLAGRTLKLGWWTLLPLALLFVNPAVLRFVGEVKPYGLDLGLAAIIIAFALKKPQPGRKWLVLGLLAPWFSLPSVFVLAAAGVASILTIIIKPTVSQAEDDRKIVRSVLRWFGIGAAWLISFGVLYVTVLQKSISSQYLAQFHAQYFFPVPGKNFDFHQALELLYSFPRQAFGFTTVAIIGGIFFSGLGLLRKYTDQKLLLLLPIVAVVITSSFGLYSLIPRLLLFTLPGCWLLAAVGSKELALDYPSSPLVKYGLPLIWVVIVGATNVVRHYVAPISFSDSRELVTNIPDGYRVVVDPGALPAWDYYRRIHPILKDEVFSGLPPTDIKQQTYPGNYILLYDVLTQLRITHRLERDSKWATERGCSVRKKPMFRAAAVMVDCP